MTKEELIRDATSAYLISYNQALKETRNPSMAVNAASVISMSYIQAFKSEVQQTIQSDQAQSMVQMALGALFGAAQNTQEEEGEESDEQK